MVDESHWRIDIDGSHLRAGELTHDGQGGHVGGDRDPFVGQQAEVIRIGRASRAVDPVRTYRRGHGLARFGIHGTGVFEELITARHHFVTAGEVFRRCGFFAIHAAIRRIEVRLQDLPFRLDLVWLTIGPVFVVGIDRIVGDELAQFHFLIVMRFGADFFDPDGFAKLKLRWCWRWWRNDHGLHLRHRIGNGGRIVGEGGCRHLHGTTMGQSAHAIVDQPVVTHRPDRLVVSHTEMLTAKVHAWVGEHVTIGRSDGSRRNRGVSGPGAIRILFALPADDALRMTHDAVVLRDLRHAVVIVIVGVADVRAEAVFDLDFEAVTLMRGVIDGVEIVDAAISDAGLKRTLTEHQKQ